MKPLTMYRNTEPPRRYQRLGNAPAEQKKPRSHSALLTVLMLFGVASSYDAAAQATASSDIDQSGTEQTATIIQENVGDSAYAAIAQSGVNHDASVYQSGTAEDFLEGYITQAGTSNSARSEQVDVVYSASLGITQNGDNNLATATQSSVFEATATLEQMGTLNDATLYQRDTDAHAIIRQDGTSNLAQLDQSGTETYFQDATVVQQGDNNTAYVLQDEMGMNIATSSQVGSGHYTEIHQFQTTDISYDEAEMNLAVEGNSNEVFAVQSTAPAGNFDLTMSGNDNRVDVFQGGENVRTTINSTGSDFNSDTVDQVGLSGTITINREFTTNSRTSVVQRPFLETATITQSDADNAVVNVQQLAGMLGQVEVSQLNAQDVTATIFQDAAISEATVEQADSTLSTATIMQSVTDGAGTNLIAFIYQREGSDMAIAEIQQTNVENLAAIEQYGVQNSEALIVQTGTLGYATIRQTSMAGGLSNSASINQAGDNYYASIEQDGSSSQAVINQM